MSIVTYKVCDMCQRKIIEHSDRYKNMIDEVYFLVTVVPIFPKESGPYEADSEKHFCNSCYDAIRGFIRRKNK